MQMNYCASDQDVEFNWILLHFPQLTNCITKNLIIIPNCQNYGSIENEYDIWDLSEATTFLRPSLRDSSFETKLITRMYEIFIYSIFENRRNESNKECMASYYLSAWLTKELTLIRSFFLLLVHNYAANYAMLEKANAIVCISKL